MKKIFIPFFITFCFLSFSEDLPKPKNNQLYTEYTSFRYAPYLKKPMMSSGYIAMNGQDDLIFKQIEPIKIIVRKIENKITYQKGNSNPIEIPSASNEILIIFGDQSDLHVKYDIKKEALDKKDKFIIIPKSNNKIKNMIMISVKDVLENLEINFSDGSRLVYEFSNSVTGVSPDKKYFE